jgi:predicted transcriptional regulator
MKSEHLMEMPALEAMTETRAFSPTQPVSKLIGYLRESKLYEGFVEEGERTSIVSVRDILNVSSMDTKLSNFMRQVPRLNQNNTVGDAAALMYEYRARSMPIYQGRNLVGQVTSPSIVSRLADSDSSTKISSIMTPEPIGLEASTKVSKAREIMLRKKIDQVPITKKEALYGIVTSEEIVFNLMPRVDRDEKGDWEKGRYDESLGVFASKDVLTNDVTSPLRDVYKSMSEKGSNYSILMGEGKVKGIVTYRDFMTLLARKRIPDSIPMYIVGLPDDPFDAERARSKFRAGIQLLRKGFPDIVEARAIIKTGNTKSPKKRYEVHVFVESPRKRYSYRVSGYDLGGAFEEIDVWVKKTLSQYRPRRRRRTEVREFPD